VWWVYELLKPSYIEVRIMAEKISIKQAAEIMQKCQQFVRVGLQRRLLPFGTAVKVNTRWNYYISPKLFYEYVGDGPERSVKT